MRTTIVVRVLLSHCEKQRHEYARCSIFGRTFSVCKKAGAHSQIDCGVLKDIRRIQSAQNFVEMCKALQASVRPQN